MRKQDNSRGVRLLPRAKVEENKVEEETKEETRPQMPEIPSIASIIASSVQPEEDNEADLAVNATISYLMRKDKEKAKMVQKTIEILPELAKSDNPLTTIMLEKILTGSSSGGNNDIAELKELAKAMSYTVLLPELMKDVAKSIRGGDNDTLAMLIQILDERDRRLQQLLQELKEERENKVVDQIRQEFYEAINAVADTFSKSLEEMKAQIAMQQMQAPVQNNPFAALEQLDEVIERSKAVLEKLGLKVIDPHEQVINSEELEIDKQIKLKELELKEKEIEAKNQLYAKLGEAMAQMLSNPDNIFSIISRLSSIFRGPVGAAPARQNASVPVGQIVMKRPSIPPLSSFVKQGGDTGVGQSD